MNITKQRLKQLIKEELTRVVHEDTGQRILAPSIDPYEQRDHVKKFFSRYANLLAPFKNNANVLGEEIAQMLLKLGIDYDTLMKIQHVLRQHLLDAAEVPPEEPDIPEVPPEEPPIEPEGADTDVEFEEEEEDLPKP